MDFHRVKAEWVALARKD